MSRILVTVGELKIASAQKDASLLGCRMVSTGKKGINNPCRWNYWDSFFRGRNFFVPENFSDWKFQSRIFLGPEIFLPEIFARKNFCGRKFSRSRFFTGSWNCDIAPEFKNSPSLGFSISALFALNNFYDRKFLAMNFFYRKFSGLKIFKRNFFGDQNFLWPVFYGRKFFCREL